MLSVTLLVTRVKLKVTPDCLGNETIYITTLFRPPPHSLFRNKIYERKKKNFPGQKKTILFDETEFTSFPTSSYFLNVVFKLLFFDRMPFHGNTKTVYK